MFVDTSATDTDPEEPANALASLGTRTVQPKLKGSKLRRSSQGSSRLFKTGKLMKAQQKMPDKLANLVRREKENIKVAVKKNKVSLFFCSMQSFAECVTDLFHSVYLFRYSVFMSLGFACLT